MAIPKVGESFVYDLWRDISIDYKPPVWCYDDPEYEGLFI